MTTLYIAGPMTGLPQFNYPAFQEASEQLRDAGYYTLSPTISHLELTAPRPEVLQTEGEWEDYMRNGINQLIRADGVAVLSGWTGSRGATIEAELAANLGMPVHMLDRWLENPPTGAS